jgi:ribosomal protein S1
LGAVSDNDYRLTAETIPDPFFFPVMASSARPDGCVQRSCEGRNQQLLSPRIGVPEVIEIGAVVDAVVSRVEPFGVYLTQDKDTIFVPLSNLAWLPHPLTIAALQPGQTVMVLVERLNYKTKVYAGSVKRLHPEENPYRAFSRQPPDQVFGGKVKMIHHDGVVVDVGKGCVGELPLTEQTKALAEGSQVQVQITALELNEQRMTLKLAPCQPT